MIPSATMMAVESTQIAIKYRKELRSNTSINVRLYIPKEIDVGFNTYIILCAIVDYFPFICLQY